MNTVDEIKKLVDNAFTPEYERKTTEVAKEIESARATTDSKERMTKYKQAFAKYKSYLSTRKFDDDKKKDIIL